jgi:transposase-like protein
VLAGLRGDRSVTEVCRDHAISETLSYGWREKLLEGGREALAGKEERQGERELRRKSPSSSGRSAARPMSWRPRETLANAMNGRSPIAFSRIGGWRLIRSGGGRGGVRGQ